MTCDARLFGDTLKEKYEGIYVKVCEMFNLAQASLPDDSIFINCGDNLASLFECSKSHPFPRISAGFNKFKIDHQFNFAPDIEVFYDEKLPPNVIQIGKNELIFENLEL